MKRITINALIYSTLIALTATSCNKDVFDQKLYDESVNFQFMVDNVDETHDWCLTKNDTMDIQVSSDIYDVQILTENPYTSTTAEIAAEGVCYGNKATLYFTLPINQTTIYIAALDKDGKYLGVVPTTYNIKEVSLSTKDLLSSTTINTPTPQTFSFLYDCNFPLPGSFDYNDMVLRIYKNLPDVANSYLVDLNVTLEACGANQLYAAAIQLEDISYDDISKVEIVGGKPLDEGYPLQRQFIESGNVLSRGRHGEAVINLFESAQWALAKQKDELGDIPVINYNVTYLDVEGKSATVIPVSATYRITFKDRAKARSLTFDRIDPFIVHQVSNGGIWEVHTYNHKFDETLRELYFGQQIVYDNHISWAVVIPQGDFRYPQEGMSMANYDKETGEVFGPYLNFAEWMKNHNSYRDWYLKLDYPRFVY